MNALIRLPFALPEEVELPGRRGFTVTDRSRIDDMERQEQLETLLDEALTPDEQIAALNALDAFQRELDEEEQAQLERDEAERELEWERNSGSRDR